MTDIARSLRAPWTRIAALLILIFLARALFYLCVLPPFEGWDEYQHLGYIASLDEHGRIPVLGQSGLPESMRPVLLAAPHPPFGASHVGFWGALSYGEFWDRPPADRTEAPKPTVPPLVLGLYQAQHPPLAYLIALPIWRVLGPRDPLAAIYAIRGLNVLLVAGGLAVFAVALRSLLPTLTARTAAMAMLCLHPLFLQNAARIANDALAVAAGIAGISVLFLARPRSPSVAAGMLYHALVSQALFGRPMTNAWYFMTAVPFLLDLLVRGAGSVHRRVLIAGCAMLSTTFLALEIHGTLIQLPPFFADTDDAVVAWARLGEIHPWFPHPVQRWFFLGAEACLLALFGATLLQVVRDRNHVAHAARLHMAGSALSSKA